ncbi:type III secretion system translocon subunit SctE [Desulfothermus sp.]
MSKIGGVGDNINVPPPVFSNIDEDLDINKLTEFVQDTLILLGKNKDQSVDGGQDTGGYGPQLPPPDSDIDSGSLATLLLKLQMDIEEKQLKGSKEFLQAKKKEMEQKNKERIDKIMKAAEKAEKADKAGKIGKIIGYIGLALTAVVAVAACVATGGLAVGPVACLLFAATMTILDETGATGKVLEGMAKVFEKMGMGKTAAMITAAIIFTFVMVYASKKFPGGAEKIAGNFVNKLGKGKFVLEEIGKTKVVMTASAAQKARLAQEAGNISKTRLMAQQLGESAKFMDDIGTVAGAGAGTASSYYQYEALNLRADAKDIQKFIAALQQKMDDEKDRIQEIIDQMQANVSIVLSILKSQVETNEVVSRQSI